MYMKERNGRKQKEGSAKVTMVERNKKGIMQQRTSKQQ